ncbi:unnamed protein product [Symbiodinium sp. CCMP2592]|nr:unnamed protein product [Symbiodinium sp. CCMP2592]
MTLLRAEPSASAGNVCVDGYMSRQSRLTTNYTPAHGLIPPVCELSARPAQLLPRRLGSHAWKRHASRQGITTASGSSYQKTYSDWVTENFSQRFKTFQIFDLAKRVMHYLNDLDCVNRFSEALGDHCDFQHENLSTLATMQNLHVFGKLVVSLSATYSLELLSEVFIVGSRYLAVSSAVPIIRDRPSGSGGDYDMPMPEWTFTKHMPAIIDRLKTEVGGASFVTKIFKPAASARAQANSDGATLDVNELLAPKKRKRATSKPKAKGKAARNRATDDDREDADQVLADVEEGCGCSRKRWWIDDLLSALIHAAGSRVTCVRRLTN